MVFLFEKLLMVQLCVRSLVVCSKYRTCVKINNNKRKRLNSEEKLNIIKTKETENLSVRVLAERFCISKSQVNLSI